MSLPPALQTFLAQLQKDCLPGIWSKGVALAREKAVSLESSKDGEITLRVQVKDRPVSPKVQLWPEDEDSYCDCGDRNELCAHIAAAAIAIKNGDVSLTAAPAERPRTSVAPRVAYRLTRDQGALSFERLLVYPDRETPLTETLMSVIGGISSGRISSPPISATREDFAADAALSPPKRGKLERTVLQRLLAALADSSSVTLDGEPIQTSAKSTGLYARLSALPGGAFKLQAEMDPSIQEVFANGAALTQSSAGNIILRPIQNPDLSPSEAVLFSKEGKIFRAREEIAQLITQILPSLESKMRVEAEGVKLPEVRHAEAKITFRLEDLGHDLLQVVPQISSTGGARPGELVIADPLTEQILARKLQHELHMRDGQALQLRGAAAVELVEKLRARSGEWDLSGNGVEKFSLAGAITPRFDASDAGLSMSFDTREGRSADPARVFQAWSEGASYVPLLGGGWAPLPKDWLAKFGNRVLAILQAREHSEKLPAQIKPQLASLCQELQEAGLEVRISEGLSKLRLRLEEHQGIPRAELPKDLRADLREYQRKGVDWLCLLRGEGMGALLADDMGLGKTLQALCAVRGRTLVICPTSVLSSWAGQIAQFRPGLKVSTYYGSGRRLDTQADITLTSYALLRLDFDALIQQDWKTIILDEAQTIKNPDSQVARSAHGLRAEFRIALSGTPIENRLDDLWSQFQFVNPGLLGTRADFREQPAERIRALIKPFLLRRLKREVAPELPPRTETVLHCDLGEDERKLYDSILAASRKEVLAKLEQASGEKFAERASGARAFNVMAALEMLLRLRQACCHPALIPGAIPIENDARSSASPMRSSKLDLLLETLDESIGLGHRGLVFSQWTSYLDLIEPRLREAGISYSRLDGSTSNRAQVVEDFQKPDGPSVMLISLKAGGVGLTLTAADHIFILDPWWNPAAEDQAADRAHRIGQQNPVLIHRLVARDTIEDRILALQKHKLELAGSVLEGSVGAAGALTLTQQDLLDLLAD